jgi:hypothetical protein
MSSDRVRLKLPRKAFAKPVRTLSTITTSFICFPSEVKVKNCEPGMLPERSPEKTASAEKFGDQRLTGMPRLDNGETSQFDPV